MPGEHRAVTPLGGVELGGALQVARAGLVGCRSAPVPGRSNVGSAGSLESSEAPLLADAAAPGDGRTPARARGVVFGKLRAGGIERREARLIAASRQQSPGLGQFAQVPADEREEIVGLPSRGAAAPPTRTPGLTPSGTGRRTRATPPRRGRAGWCRGADTPANRALPPSEARGRGLWRHRCPARRRDTRRPIRGRFHGAARCGSAR